MITRQKMKKKTEKRKRVQEKGGGLYRLLDMHGRFQKVLEGFEKLQCMRDFMRFHQVLSVSRRFWLVPEGSIGF